MATIDELRKSISEMSDEELVAIVIENRKSRRTSKRPEKAAAKKSKTATGKLAKLSVEDLEKLLSALED